MTQYSCKDGDARTGSNVRGEPLLAHRRGEITRETHASERLAKDYHRQSKKLFSKADLRRAAEMGREANREWREASIAAKGDSLRIDALKRSVRNTLERRLARELSGYRQWRTIQKAHLRAQSKASQARLAARRFPGVSIDWDCVLPFDPGPSQTFVAPFTTFDVQMIDTGGIHPSSP